MNNFQIGIFQKVCDTKKNQGKNLMISPLSIYHILSLTTNGASNNTLKEMLHVLCHNIKEEMNEVNKIISSVTQKLKTVEISNALFTRIKPLYSFMENIKEYKAKVDELKDVDQINKWCSDATHGKIKKIIQYVNPKDLMILINAIYFKGKWEKVFDVKFTSQKIFTNYKKEKKRVDFMYMSNKLNYFEDNSLQAISLKYKEDKINAIIILPKKETNINNFIHNFNYEQFNQIKKGLKINKVKLYLPKFEIEFEDELNDYFKSLGMNDAFDKKKADFTLIKPKEIIFISQIIHKEYIKVDEEGTEAAAVTAIITTKGRKAEEKEIIMNVNHPFLFIIINNDLPAEHNILFITKIDDLGEEKLGAIGDIKREIKRKSRSNSKKTKSRSRSKKG